ncbi:hypothetical protein [Streptomyces sp. C10-9-1]|uniref:hypothetical protein n=1 Tax=Streptomyces sp. C10-9-1 TaxID=1859285 RepID=UPI003F4A3836
MKHARIDPTFGGVSFRTDAPDWDTLVGPEGKDHVRLDPSLGMAAWVNDVGLRYPARYPRNVVGSCLLVAMGAALQPYAGPIVLTGWDPHGTPTEICDLRMPEEAIRRLHDRVRAALDHRPVPLADRHFAQAMRTAARHVRSAPTPTLSIAFPDQEPCQ